MSRRYSTSIASIAAKGGGRRVTVDGAAPLQLFESILASRAAHDPRIAPLHALFSNTERAHRLGRDARWVVVYVQAKVTSSDNIR
jgi:hypothetical protein